MLAVENITVAISAVTILRNLSLSVPTGDDLELFRAMAIAHRALESPGEATVAAADRATAEWERMIADEVGDAVRARVIRLVGDGLAMNAIAGIGTAPSSDELRELEQHLIGERRADRA